MIDSEKDAGTRGALPWLLSHASILRIALIYIIVTVVNKFRQEGGFKDYYLTY